MKQLIKMMNTKISIVLICFIFILLLCHIFHIETNYIDGDKCAMLLQGVDILNGNLFLNNWYSTQLIFALTELPSFLLSVKIFGISPNSIYFAASFSFFLCFVFSFFLIKDDIKKLTPLNLIILISLVGFSNLFIRLAYGHSGSFACCLIMLFFADRFVKTDKKLFLILFMSCISLFVFADVLIAPVILIPIFLFAFFKFFHRCEIKKYLKLILFLFAGILIGYLFLNIYLKQSNMVNNYVPEHFIFLYIPQIFHFFLLTIRQIFVLFGVDYCNRSILDIAAFFTIARIFIILVSGYLVFLNIKKSILNDKPDFISSTMSYGILIMVLLMISTTYQVDMFIARYLAFVPFFSAVIILRYFSNFENLLKIQYIIVISYLLLSLSAMVYLSGKITEDQSYNNLQLMIMSYLKHNNLNYGVTNDFFSITPVTLLSDNYIKVRAVEYNRGNNDIVPYEWFAKKEWFREPVQFVIVNTDFNNSSDILSYYEDKFKSRIYIYQTVILILKDEFVQPVVSDNQD